MTDKQLVVFLGVDLQSPTLPVDFIEESQKRLYHLSPAIKRTYCWTPHPNAVTDLAHSGPSWLTVTADTGTPSLNAALAYAGRFEYDLLICLHNCFPPSAEAIEELYDIFEEDPHLGISSPRIRDLSSGGIVPADPEKYGRGLFHEKVLEYLPEKFIITEYPSPCLLLRRELTANLGLLDLYAPQVIQAITRYMIKARRLGFRLALANRAVVSMPDALRTQQEVWLQGKQDMEGTPNGNQQQVEAHASPLSLAPESAIANIFNPGGAVRKTLLFDMSGLGPLYNGTSFTMINLAKALHEQAREWEFYYMASAETAAFHRLEGKLPGWSIVDPRQSEKCTMAFRPNQPWSIGEILQLHRLAYYNVFTMLDTISWDIQYCAPPHLDSTWRFMAEYADLIIFDSHYSQKRFNLRFSTSPAVREAVLHYSFDPEDYQRLPSYGPSLQSYLLIIGNNLDHKWVTETVQLIRSAFPFRRIIVVGDGTRRVGAECLESGTIPDDQLETLFAQAGLIIYPSFYEGFGLPILKGLSYGKTVLARYSALNLELAANYRGDGTLVLFKTPMDLYEKIGRISHNLPVEAVPLGGAIENQQKPLSWIDVGRNLLNLFEEIIRSPQRSNHLRRQKFIQFGRNAF